MGVLVLAALIWLGLHIGVAGTRLRATIVGMRGERTFAMLFSAASIVSLLFLAVAYRSAGSRLLWVAPPWLVGALDVAMLPACLLFVGALSPANPTMMGTERAAPRVPAGIFRITRHPMLNAFGIWATVHMIANGDTASLVFFGTFLLTVLVGIPSLDAKLAWRDPARWAVVAGGTSALPFAAIAAGRARVRPGEIGWRVPLLGLLLWLVLIALHGRVIGVPALPY